MMPAHIDVGRGVRIMDMIGKSDVPDERRERSG